MITRWRYCLDVVMMQYCLSAAMITRWHHCISVEMVTGYVHWTVNVSNCKELWIERRKHQHLKTAGKTTNKKTLDGYHRKRERDEWTQNRERGRKDTVIYQKGG